MIWALLDLSLMYMFCSYSSASNSNGDTDEAEDDEIHLNQSEKDRASPMKDVDWFEKNLNNDIVMVEGDQFPLMDQPPKETEGEKSSSGEEIEDSGTPFTHLPIPVDQETFTDLRKRDSMAALRLIYENKSSILASPQVTPPSASNNPSTNTHEQIL